MKMQQCLFIVKDKQLLKKYIKIWETIAGLIKINLESKPVYGDHDIYIKTKIKIYAGSIITNFHNKKMPKEKVPCKCLLIIMIDSVIRVNKKYYSQTLLEECKYIQEKIKIENYLNEDLEDQITALMTRMNLTLIMKNNLLKNNTYNITSGSR